VPPSDSAPDGHTDAAQAGDAGHAARAPLGEWRGPAFWMACGALVAGLAAAAVIVLQRVAVERDMMAVAATLPQPAAQVIAPAAAQSPAAAPVEAAPVTSAALQPSAAQPGGHAPHVRRDAVRRPPASAGARTVGAVRVKSGKARPKLSAAARRNRIAVEAKYAEVFKRCPPLGERGAVQCRRDICNGAEGRGPACKPYVRKLP
jgi:hypothetical protein